MKLQALIYSRIKKAVIVVFLMVFSFSSFAADSMVCVYLPAKEVKKENKCCTQKKKSCSQKKENKCPVPTDGKTNKNGCGKCTFKENDNNSPATINKPFSQIKKPVNEEKIIFSPLIKDDRLSSNERWRTPCKENKIFLKFSDLRI